MRQAKKPFRLHQVAAAACVACGALPAQAIDVTWVGSSGGQWNVPANWNPSSPGAGDNALLGAFDTLLNAGTFAIQSFTGTGTLTISGGSLVVTQASSIGNLVMTGGSLGGAGTVTAGTLNWSGGQMGTSGGGGGVTTITGVSTIDGIDTNYLYYGRTLNLNGNTSWTQGTGGLYVYSANQGTSTLNIGSGTTFTDAGTTSAGQTRYIGYYSDGVVNNAGTYQRNGVGTTSLSGGQFNNTGTVNVAGGTFDLGPGSSSGTFNVASGTTLSFGGSGTFNVNGGTISNAGTLKVASGTANINAGVTYSGSGNIEVSGGVLNSALGTTLSPANLTISGGSARFAGAVNTTTLAMTGGYLSGPGTVTAGTLNWSGGQMGENLQGGGTTTITGASTIDGTDNNYLYYGRTLNLNGNTSWTQGTGTIYVYSGGQGTSTLNIGSGTAFTDAGTVTAGQTRYIGYQGDGVVNNAGTYQRNGVGTTSLSGGQFNNTGTVNVAGGTFDLGPGSSSGTFNVASGTTLSFGSGTFNVNGGTISNAGTLKMAGGTANINAGVTYSGSGNIEVSGGVLNSALGTTLSPANLTISSGSARFAGAVNTTALAMTGGYLSGPGTVTAGTLNWSGGTMGENLQGGGTTTITGASTIDGTDNNYLYYGRTLNLNGNTSWTQGTGIIYVYSASQGTSTLNIGAGTTFTDAGTVTAGQTRYIGYYGDGVVNNAGTYQRNGLGTTSLYSAQFNNTGTVNVASGTFDLGPGSSSGTFNVASGTTLSFTQGTFNLTGGSLANSATVLIGGGTAVVSAPLTYSGSGALQINSGTLRLLAGASMSANSVAMTGGTLGGAGTLTAGTLNWSGGTMGESGQGGGTTTITGASTIDGADTNYLYYGRTLNLNGNTSWSQGTGSLYVYGGGQGTSTLNIGAGATFTDAGTVSAGQTRYIGNYGDGVVNNAGTYQRNGVGTTSLNGGQFNNTGTVNVAGGTFDLGPGSSSGTFNVASGTTLSFTSGTFNVTGGSLVNNGTALIASGTVVVSAPVAASGNGVLQIDSGTLRLLAGSSMAPSNLVMNGGTLGGPGALTAGTLNWSGGFMGESGQGGGVTTVTGASTIDGTAANYVYYGRTLNLNGNTSWTQGNGVIYVYSGGQGTSTLNIGAGATFTDAGAATSAGIKYLGDYNDGNINNAGTIVRSGVGTTAVGPLDNPGTITVNGGTLRFGGTTTSSGTLNVAASALMELGATSFTLAGGTVVNNGTMRLSSGNLVVSAPPAYSGSGVFEITGGSLRAATNFTVGNFLFSGGTIGANGQTNGTMTATGATTIDGTAANYVYYGHTLNLNGNTSWTQGNGGIYLYSAGQGTSTLNIGAGTTFTDAGAATSAGIKYLGYYNDGIINNAGTIVRNGVGTTSVGHLDNPGTISVNGGTLRFDNTTTSSGTLNVAANALMEFSTASFTLAGGTVVNNGTMRLSSGGLVVSAPPAYSGSGVFEITGGSLRAATTFTVGNFLFSGGTIGVSGQTNGVMTATGATTIDGTDTSYLFYGHTLTLNGNTSWTQGNGTIAVYSGGQGTSTLNIGAGTTFTDAGAATAAGTKYLGSYSDGQINNAGTIQRNGVGTTAVQQINNSGTINVNGGAMTFNSLQGTGTLQVGTDGNAVLTASNSTVGTLQHNGSAAGSLNLGARTITVSTDYDNANFGVGNAFNRRANITTTGTGNRLIAAGDVNQALSGAGVSGGATTAPSIVIGNVHVGATDIAYQIANSGSNGPSLRGAIQPGVNGGNITDGRLSGDGVTSSNWGPVAPGESTTRNITVTINTAGVYAPISGQTVSIVNNFENTRSQVLTISSSSGAAAYNLAAAAAVTPNPVNLGNQRVGGSSSGALTIANIAPTGAFTEKLNASFGATTGSTLTNGGSVSLLAAGSSNNSAMALRLDGSTAGAKTGTVQVLLESDGQGTSGLGITALTSQTVTVNGSFYNAAVGSTAPTPVTLGNQRVGGSASQALTVSNTTAAGSFSEALNASFGSNTGGATNNGGSISNLVAGGSNALAMSVGVNTSTAGAKNGSVTINYQTDGTGPNGNSGLAAISAGSQVINVSGNVYNMAVGSTTPTPVVIANQRVGGSGSQTLTVGNTAAAGAFSEALNASFGSNTGAATNNGGSIANLAAGSNNAAAMSVGVNTSSAGAKAGSVTINYQSDGTGPNGNSGLAAVSAGSQTINVSGNVYRTAIGSVTPSPIAFGSVRVGGSAQQALTISNTAASDGFSESLNASFGSTTGSAVGTSGSVNALAAGASNSSAMTVSLSTASAGAKSGTVGVNYVSTGAGTSGLADVSAGGQTISFSGNVYQLAAGQLNTAPLNFGTVQVGQSVSQVLSITNSAAGPTGFVEDLNVRFGASSGQGSAQINGSGSISALAAGATNASAMTVSVNTGAAGTINGSILVNYYSAGSVGGVGNGLAEVGVGSSNYAVSGVIQSQGQVIDQALPVLNTASVNFGNVRIGSAAPSQLVSMTNQATGNTQAALNASISGAGAVTASGSFNLLAPGATDSTSLQVGMSTATAGAINGNASIALVSDASNVGGCAPNCQVVLAPQNVAVSGAVYRLANPTINTPSLNLAARVGDVAPTAQISVTNASPDQYTERLNATIGAGPGGFSTSGSITGLAAQGTSTALGVGLNTASAGQYGGNVALSFVSSGAGTTGAPDQSLASQNVAVSGKVYTPAVAQLNNTVVDFGIVHKGDVVAAKNVSVTNAAAVAAPNDVLVGNLGGAAGPFNASGALAGVAAQATDSTSLKVALNTASAGVFTGQATGTFASHNAEMADLSLGTANVTLQAQVNNFAELALSKTGGAGQVTKNGQTYTLEFGSLLQGSASLDATLAVLNIASGPADALSGSFAPGAGGGFVLTGFDSFSGLGAGDSFGGLGVSFGSGTLGSFTQTIVISSAGSNASGYFGALPDTTLVLHGSVVAVPEPETYALMAGGLLVLWLARRRRMRPV